MTSYYEKIEKSGFFVIEERDEIIGCGGFGPLKNLIAEMQKVYIAERFRGKGLATDLVKMIEVEARKIGYRQLYLETASTLSRATAVYKHMGYCALSQPIANDQGHIAMDIWMIKDL